MVSSMNRIGTEEGGRNEEERETIRKRTTWLVTMVVRTLDG